MPLGTRTPIALASGVCQYYHISYDDAEGTYVVSVRNRNNKKLATVYVTDDNVIRIKAIAEEIEKKLTRSVKFLLTPVCESAIVNIDCLKSEYVLRQWADGDGGGVAEGCKPSPGRVTL